MGSKNKATGQTHASRQEFWRNEKSVYSSDIFDDSTDGTAAVEGDLTDPFEESAFNHVAVPQIPSLDTPSLNAGEFDDEWARLCGHDAPTPTYGQQIDPGLYDEDGNSAHEYDDDLAQDAGTEFRSPSPARSSDFYATKDDICEFDAEASYVNFNDFEFGETGAHTPGRSPLQTLARFARATTALAGALPAGAGSLYGRLIGSRLKQTQDGVFTLSAGGPRRLSLRSLSLRGVDLRAVSNQMLGNWSRHRPAIAMAGFAVALAGGIYTTVAALNPGTGEKEPTLIASQHYSPYTRLRTLPQTPAADALASTANASDALRGSTAPSAPQQQPDATGAPTAEPDTAPVVEVFTTRTVTLGKGDTLSVVLARAGVSAPDIHRTSRALAKTFSPKRLRAGQEITLTFQNVPHADSETVQASLALPAAYDIIDFGSDHSQDETEFTPRLVAMEMKTALDRSVRVERTGATEFTSREIMAELHEQYAHAYGEISSSLYVSAMKEHVPAQAVAELIRLYSYDVDFQRDIRAGDSFEIFYKEFTNDDGEIVKTGEVLFASLNVHGEPYAYYRFVTPDDGIEGYYDASGQSAKKFLMKTPVDGARISSPFGMREHPILGYTKKHTGIDFAVRAGTPIMAAGNGVIERASLFGSYGNFVLIRHSNGYETAYAHMQGYGPGIKAGAKVKQGQIIGYVGTTGRSTGPHLHYEVRKSGVKINPASVKTMNGRKLTGDMLTAFNKEIGDIETDMAAYPVDKPVVTASATPMDKPSIK